MSVRLLLCLCLIGNAALASAPEVSAEPRRVVLGENTQVSVRVRAANRGQLRRAASMGELTVVESGNGPEHRFTWSPPDTRIPAIAVLLFWQEEDDAPPDVATVRITLIGRTDLEVTTEPSASVKVEVGGRLFGPRKADAAGHVSVPIEVPPGVGDARVLGEREGQATEVRVPLGVPPYNPLVAILGPDPLYSEGQGWLWVFDASDVYADKITLAVRGGSAKEAETTRHGTLFELSPAARSKRLSVVATAKGNPEARAEASTQLVPGKPPEAPVKKPQSGMRLPTPSIYPAVSAGGYFAGGANLGLAAALSASVHLVGPLSLDGAVGVRRSALSTRLSGLGELNSSVMSIPLTLAVGWRAVSAGPWTISLRAGAGLLPFVHVITSSFQPTAAQSGLGWESFVAAEVAHDVGPLELFFEARGAYSPVSTAQLSAQMGGVMLSFGLRRSGT